MTTPSPRHLIAVKTVGDVTIVTFAEASLLDEQNTQPVSEQLHALLHEGGQGKLLLDLANVRYFSSAALGLFIVLHKRLEDTGGRMILCCIAPQLMEVFEVTRLDRYFRIVADEPAALRAFAEAR